MASAWRSSRRGALALPAALAACLLPAVAACGRDCRDSALAVESVADGRTITARMTSDGDPVAGKRLTFTLDSEGISGKTGRLAGYADTDGDGRAVLRVDGGFAGFVGEGDTPTGVRVSFGEFGGSGAYCSPEAQRDLP